MGDRITSDMASTEPTEIAFRASIEPVAADDFVRPARLVDDGAPMSIGPRLRGTDSHLTA